MAFSEIGAVFASWLYLIVGFFEQEVELGWPPASLLFHILELVIALWYIGFAFVYLVHCVIHIDSKNYIIQWYFLVQVVERLWRKLSSHIIAHFCILVGTLVAIRISTWEAILGLTGTIKLPISCNLTAYIIDFLSVTLKSKFIVFLLHIYQDFDEFENGIRIGSLGKRFHRRLN